VTHRRDTDWDELTRELVARVQAHGPEWTNQSVSDPGITIVELIEFLADSILARADASPEARERLGDLADRLQRATSDPDCPDGTLTRNRFFSGKLLTADDLELEQRYLRDTHRRHNRLLHGTGVVHGLEVTLEVNDEGDGLAVTVSPGLAISPLGDELVVCDPVRLDPCPDPPTCRVTIGLAERLVAPTPNGPSRVEETAQTAVGAAVPGGHLAIARLVHDGDAWRVDTAFQPSRVR